MADGIELIAIAICHDALIDLVIASGDGVASDVDHATPATLDITGPRRSPTLTRRSNFTGQMPSRQSRLTDALTLIDYK